MFLKRLLASLALLGALAASAGAEAIREDLTVTSATGEHRFAVEIADDSQERARGLMFRRSMPDGEGMLFDFGEEQPASFWMENTYIPLDMLFIKENGMVESIAERTTPLSRAGVPSKGPVRYVLEINGGLSDKLGIKPGDKVSGPALEANE